MKEWRLMIQKKSTIEKHDAEATRRRAFS